MSSPSLTQIPPGPGKYGLNPLGIGYTSVDALEDRVVLFRYMNQENKKKRFLYLRESFDLRNGKPPLPAGSIIDENTMEQIQRNFRPRERIPTFQCDEGMVFVMGRESAGGARDRQIACLDFLIDDIIDDRSKIHLNRVVSLHDLLHFYHGMIFPRLIILTDQLHSLVEWERVAMNKIFRLDRFARVLQVQVDRDGVLLFPDYGQTLNFIDGRQDTCRYFQDLLVQSYSAPYSDWVMHQLMGQPVF